MAKIVAMFNHKGGVSKTTSTFNIGWMLADIGMRVLLVDCDPQCNLTGLILDYRHDTDYPFTGDETNPLNIRDGLAPAFDGRPIPLSPVTLLACPH